MTQDDIEECLTQLHKTSKHELKQQKLMQDTPKQQQQMKKIFTLKVSFDKAVASKIELKLELGHICSNAENTLHSKKPAKLEAAHQ